MVSILKQDSSAVILKAFIDALEALPDFTEEAVTACFKAIMKETGIKGRAAFEPARIALTGVTKGPGMYEMIVLFGREKTLALLRKALAFVKQNKYFEIKRHPFSDAFFISKQFN